MASPDTTPTTRTTSEELAEHMHLVHRIVARFMRRLPSSVQREDLMAAGTFGLFQALRSSSHTCPEMFVGYARIRIRGAIVDELRRHDWSPRRRREVAAPAAKAPIPTRDPANENDTPPLSRRLPNGALLRSIPCGPAAGAPAAPEELAAPRAPRVTVVGFDDLPPAIASALEEDARAGELGWGHSPEGEVDAKWTYAALHAAVSELPEREQAIIRMRYFDGMASKAIASELGLSEARISQLHARATARLREILAERGAEVELAA